MSLCGCWSVCVCRSFSFSVSLCSCGPAVAGLCVFLCPVCLPVGRSVPSCMCLFCVVYVRFVCSCLVRPPVGGKVVAVHCQSCLVSLSFPFFLHTFVQQGRDSMDIVSLALSGPIWPVMQWFPSWARCNVQSQRMQLDCKLALANAFVMLPAASLAHRWRGSIMECVVKGGRWCSDSLVVPGWLY